MYCYFIFSIFRAQETDWNLVYFRVRISLKRKWENNAKIDLRAVKVWTGLQYLNFLSDLWFCGDNWCGDRWQPGIYWPAEWLHYVSYTRSNLTTRVELKSVLFGSYFMILLYLFHGSYIIVLPDRVQLKAGPNLIGCGHLSGIWMGQKYSSSLKEEDTKFRMLTAYGNVLSSVM
jgi:hypothetical protein